MLNGRLLSAMGTAAVVVSMAGLLSGQVPDRPAFDVVSIKRNTSARARVNVAVRPDGGITMLDVPTITLLTRAFPPFIPLEMLGLPGWASTERYDIRTTSPLEYATGAQRADMIRNMLADRYKLLTHVQARQTSVYELVLARSDGDVGAGLTKSDVDCEPIFKEREGNEVTRPPEDGAERAASLPECTLRTMAAETRNRYGDRNGRLGDLLEGESTMDMFARFIRVGVDRPVINKTGLTGTYHFRMNFQQNFGGRGPSALNSAQEDAAPSIFTALQNQLGLKLRVSQGLHDWLVIDRIERPTED
jgi:uncharacterized protein (TIGR03435 family)